MLIICDSGGPSEDRLRPLSRSVSDGGDWIGDASGDRYAGESAWLSFSSAIVADRADPRKRTDRSAQGEVAACTFQRQLRKAACDAR